MLTLQSSIPHATSDPRKTGGASVEGGTSALGQTRLEEVAERDVSPVGVLACAVDLLVADEADRGAIVDVHAAGLSR